MSIFHFTTQIIYLQVFLVQPLFLVAYIVGWLVFLARTIGNGFESGRRHGFLVLPGVSLITSKQRSSLERKQLTYRRYSKCTRKKNKKKLSFLRSKINLLNPLAFRAIALKLAAKLINFP